MAAIFTLPVAPERSAAFRSGFESRLRTEREAALPVRFPRGLCVIRRIGSADTQSEFTAVFERDGQFVIACCPEGPGASGQGATKDEARESLIEAIALILEDRREDGLRGVPADAERETIKVTVRGAARTV